MELLWLANKPLSVDKIVEAAGAGWTKLRKQQNVRACLIKLQQLGMVHMKEPSAYYAAYTKKELEAILKKERDNDYQKDSVILKLKKFLKTDGLSEEDVEELKKLLYEEEGHEENIGR